MELKVSRLHRISGDGSVKGFADVVIDDRLLIKGLRIIQGRQGLFVSMPREKGKDNRWFEVVHPLDKELKEDITGKILDAYAKEVA